jgi:excisionase family DNA binding protein
MVDNDLLSIRDVSQKLKVPERTLRHWVRNRVIAGFKLGKKKWVFRAVDVERSARRLGRWAANDGGRP